jgi:arylsulfatase A-like enzyme
MRKGRYPGGPLDITGMDEQQQKRATYQRYIKSYLRCIASVDDNVGRLLDYLTAEGLLDDTVVIYTSDQGMFLGEHGWFDKRLMFEESIRMPFVVRYPREIRPGSVCDRLILNVDFAETWLDFAGAPIPEEMQGRSFRPLLRGSTPADWRRSMFYAYYEGGPHYGVRTDRYKLICYEQGKHAAASEHITNRYKFSRKARDLFDLKSDPLELKSVYHDPQCAQVLKEMEAELERLMRELKVTPDDLPSAWRLRHQEAFEEAKDKRQ